MKNEVFCAVHDVIIFWITKRYNRIPGKKTVVLLRMLHFHGNINMKFFIIIIIIIILFNLFIVII